MQVPKRYSKFLGTTLAEKIDEFAEGSHHEQIALYEELAIVRVMASRVLKMCEPVFDGTVKKDSIAVVAMGALNDAMENVRRMVETVAKIEKNSDGKISLGAVNMLICQIIKVLHKKYPNDLEELEAMIRDIRLPVENHNPMAGFVEGTDSTPDMEVTEMDESVVGI